MEFSDVKMKWRLKICLSHEWDKNKMGKNVGKKPQQMAFLAAVMNWKMEPKFRKVQEHRQPHWMAFLNQLPELRSVLIFRTVDCTIL